MLRPPNERAYERLLLFGGPGAGKTYAWLRIAKLALQTKSDARFFCLDTDFAVPRMLADPEFLGLDVEDGGNVEARQVDDWTDLTTALDKFRDQMRPQDWLVIDMISFAWEAVQNHYTSERYGVDAGNYFLQFAKTEKKGNALSGDTDWGVINALYKRFAGKLLRLQGHLLCTAPMKAVGDRDDQAIKDMYGRYGVRPEGQKHLGHQMHDVLILREDKTGARRVTTVKARSRKQLEGDEVKDFALSYLVKVGGWRP